MSVSRSVSNTSSGPGISSSCFSVFSEIKSSTGSSSRSSSILEKLGVTSAPLFPINISTSWSLGVAKNSLLAYGFFSNWFFFLCVITSISGDTSVSMVISTGDEDSSVGAWGVIVSLSTRFPSFVIISFSPSRVFTCSVSSFSAIKSNWGKSTTVSKGFNGISISLEVTLISNFSVLTVTSFSLSIDLSLFSSFSVNMTPFTLYRLSNFILGNNSFFFSSKGFLWAGNSCGIAMGFFTASAGVAISFVFSVDISLSIFPSAKILTFNLRNKSEL